MLAYTWQLTIFQMIITGLSESHLLWPHHRRNTELITEMCKVHVEDVHWQSLVWHWEVLRHWAGVMDWLQLILSLQLPPQQWSLLALLLVREATVLNDSQLWSDNVWWVLRGETTALLTTPQCHASAHQCRGCPGPGRDIHHFGSVTGWSRAC